MSIAALGGLLLTRDVNHWWAFIETREWLVSVLSKIDDALLAAAVLGAVVDPAIHRMSSKDLGLNLLFEELTGKAPETFRPALEALAQQERYFEQTSWKLQFDRLERPGLVRLKIEMDATGVNCTNRDLTPIFEGWLLNSVGGFDSRLEEHRIRVPVTNAADHLSPDELRATPQPHGTHVVSTRASKVRVPPGERYETHRVASLVRAMDDSFPLVNQLQTKHSSIEVTGSAVPLLHIGVFHAGGAGSYEWKIVTAKKPLKFDSVSFPGQVTVVSWAPISGRAKGT